MAFVPGPCIDRLRARDLASVAGWLEFRQPRRAKAILVTGRAGFGKSLLASQALDLAQRLGCTTVSFAGSVFASQSMLAAQIAEQLLNLARANVLALEGELEAAVDLLGKSAHELTRLGSRWRGALAHRNAAVWSRRAGFAAGRRYTSKPRSNYSSESTPLPTSIKSAPRCCRSVCAHQGARDCDMPR